MGRRVDVDETLPPVRVAAELPTDVWHELCQHAIECLPEECCGLVVGDDRQRYQRSVKCKNDMTRLHAQDPQTYPRDGRNAFYMNEVEYLRVRDEAEAAGQRVTAIYHSHVGYGAYLSEMDLDYAEHVLFPFPDADQIVLSVFDRKVGPSGLFRRSAGENGSPGDFVGHRIEREHP